jgi:hypothetical protein
VQGEEEDDDEVKRMDDVGVEVCDVFAQAPTPGSRSS